MSLENRTEEVGTRKVISIKEFRESGYLQELNRRFLHPLGLALFVNIMENGEELGGVYDFRDDPEGVYFDYKNSTCERRTEHAIKSNFIDKEIEKRAEERINLFGGRIESID